MLNIEELKRNLLKAIAKTEEKLEKPENIGWKETYQNYADKMLKYHDKKKELGTKFHEWEPFKCYLNVGDAKTGAEKLKVTLRYLGQVVAELTIDNDNIIIDTSNQNETNEKNFLTPESIRLENANWNSEKAKKFREYFRIQKPVRVNVDKSNGEHRIESALITEFSKTSSKNKLLCGIQPITFAGFRLAVPTAIKASDTIEMGGGHIDITVRIQGGDIGVIEVKDENKKEEPVEKVLEQATGYAVFLLKLLRSEGGSQWYKILGFGKELKEQINIKVCSAMPIKEDGTYEQFENFKLECGNDTLEYHWLYFKEDNGKITEIKTSINQKD